MTVWVQLPDGSLKTRKEVEAEEQAKLVLEEMQKLQETKPSVATKVVQPVQPVQPVQLKVGVTKNDDKV